MLSVVRLESGNQTTWKVLASVFVAWLTQIYIDFLQISFEPVYKTNTVYIASKAVYDLLAEKKILCVLVIEDRRLTNLGSPIAECDPTAP